MKRLMEKYRLLIRYFMKSCCVTVLDVAVVWLLYRVLAVDIVVSNTVGVICGFITDYIITGLFVFEKAKNKRGFAIFFGTFLIGLVLADAMIALGNSILFVEIPKWNFLLSKGLSIAVPFFVMYFIRKFLYSKE